MILTPTLILNQIMDPDNSFLFANIYLYLQNHFAEFSKFANILHTSAKFRRSSGILDDMENWRHVANIVDKL